MKPNRPPNQSINQSINQSVSQSVSQSVNQSINTLIGCEWAIVSCGIVQHDTVFGGCHGWVDLGLDVCVVLQSHQSIAIRVA
jgi:hypothetical protein